MGRDRGLVLAVISLALLTSNLFAEVKIGSLVVAYWQQDGTYYFGTPVEYDDTVKGGAFLVVFEDGSKSLVPAVQVLEYRLTVGTRVLARWGLGGRYPGKVARIVGNAVYVLFDDGDEDWTSLAGIALRRETVEK